MSLCKQIEEIGLCNSKGYSPCPFSAAAASLCPRGAGEREKRARAENDGHAFGFFFYYCTAILESSPFDFQARKDPESLLAKTT